MSSAQTRTVKLSTWAKLHGYSYSGALKCYHRGGIEGAYQIATGTIFVPVEDTTSEKKHTDVCRAVLYSRVSTRKQADSLPSQAERIEAFALGKSWKIVNDVREIGSGLNENRRSLLKILDDTQGFDILVVEHRDRLARFGTKWIEGWLSATGREVVYVNDSETRGDTESLTNDLIAIITSFCGRIYGKRGADVRRAMIGELRDD